jgi:hypothetical protein
VAKKKIFSFPDRLKQKIQVIGDVLAGNGDDFGAQEAAAAEDAITASQLGERDRPCNGLPCGLLLQRRSVLTI